MIVTQAGSPYFANRAFRCIEKTLSEAGFNTVPIHNQIITLGEWGWILGIKGMDSGDFLQHLRNLDFQGIDTHWINREAMTLMTSFGKAFDPDAFKEVETNTIHNPVLFKYYLNGSWDLY
jgi:spermidine synthase